MKEEEILDAPDDAKVSVNKWKYAFIAMLIMCAGHASTLIFFNNWMVTLYIGIILGLYFFIKKVTPDFLNQKELFLWSMFIVFSSFLIFLFLIYNFGKFSDLNLVPWDIIMSLLFSLTSGYIPAIGIFHFVKNKNWAMLILMIFISLISLTSFYPFI